MRSTLVSAAFFATSIALDTSVWTFDKAAQGPAISAENARIVLAHRLGLSRYHEIGNADEHTLGLLNDAQIPLFTVDQPSRRLMLVVEGIQDGFLATAPSFTIDNGPISAANARLVNDLLLQDMHRRSASDCGRGKATGLIQGGISANNPAGLCTIETQKEFLELTALEQLQSLGGAVDTLTSTIYQGIQSPEVTSDFTGIFHIKALEDAASKDGVKSSQYNEMSSAVRNLISEAQSSGQFSQLIVVGVPHQSGLAKRGDYVSYAMPIQARKEKPLSDATIPSTAGQAQATFMSNRTLPKTTLPVCWYSESACKSNTLDCSGHGSCHKKYAEKVSEDEAGAECWACACTPTYIDQKEGRKTIFWGGPACQKKDISVPFFLFAGFGIAALTALTYGVGMLYSIGEEDLPSVLGAGVAPSSRK